MCVTRPYLNYGLLGVTMVGQTMTAQGFLGWGCEMEHHDMDPYKTSLEPGLSVSRVLELLCKTERVMTQCPLAHWSKERGHFGR